MAYWRCERLEEGWVKLLICRDICEHFSGLCEHFPRPGVASLTACYLESDERTGYLFER